MPETFLLLFSFEGAILHKDSAEQIFIGEAEARRRNGITSSADNEAYGNLIKLIRRRWLGGPPVPIPNTEVKHPYAESTWLETAREVRELPVLSVRILRTLFS